MTEPQTRLIALDELTDEADVRRYLADQESGDMRDWRREVRPDEIAAREREGADQKADRNALILKAAHDIGVKDPRAVLAAIADEVPVDPVGVFDLVRQTADLLNHLGAHDAGDITTETEAA